MPSTTDEAAEFRAALTARIEAGYPLLYVETAEQARACALIAEIVTTPPLNRGVLLYTVADGLHAAGGTDEEAELPDIADAVARVREIEQPTVAVLRDVHFRLGSDSAPPDPETIRALLDAADAFRRGEPASTLVIVAPVLRLPPDLERETVVLDLPLPSAAEIERLLRTMVRARGSDLRVDIGGAAYTRLIHAARGLTLAEAEGAFARVFGDGVLEAADVPAVLAEKRQAIRKAGLLDLVEAEADLAAVGGLASLKRWLTRRGGAWLPEAAAWSIAPPRGLLMTGIPGCGKSLTARAIAGAWSLPLLRLDVGRIFGGLIGASEANIRAALRLAEAVAPCVLWIDEIEKGFAAGDNDGGTTRRVLATFLTWMQERRAPVFVVATANAIEDLPPEFLRKGRFDETFFVDLPDEEERRAVWAVQLRARLSPPSRAAGLNLSADLIATLAAASEDFSGAEIAAAVEESCYAAFAERRAVTEADLLGAAAATVPLAITQAEAVARSRAWAASRAVAAS